MYRQFNMAPFKPDSETWDQYVIRAGHYTEHEVCDCCLSIIANAEGCHDDSCDTCGQDVGEGHFAAMARAYPGHLTLGAFTDRCGHDASSDEHSDECEMLGFKQTSCTWCGVHAHGDRYAAVFWPAQPDQVTT